MPTVDQLASMHLGRGVDVATGVVVLVVLLLLLRYVLPARWFGSFVRLVCIVVVALSGVACVLALLKTAPGATVAAWLVVGLVSFLGWSWVRDRAGREAEQERLKRARAQERRRALPPPLMPPPSSSPTTTGPT